jgi:hypothetical protein
MGRKGSLSVAGLQYASLLLANHAVSNAHNALWCLLARDSANLLTFSEHGQVYWLCLLWGCHIC